jgi:hypothetical protein
MQSICAQLPLRHCMQISMAAQSVATLHSGFAGGAHVSWHAPWTQRFSAQEPSTQGGQAPRPGQSASVVHVPPEPPQTGKLEEHVPLASQYFKTAVSAQVGSLGSHWEHCSPQALFAHGS